MNGKKYKEIKKYTIALLEESGMGWNDITNEYKGRIITRMVELLEKMEKQNENDQTRKEMENEWNQNFENHII